jgi:hypothetical protein
LEGREEERVRRVIKKKTRPRYGSPDPRLQAGKPWLYAGRRAMHYLHTTTLYPSL